MWYPAKVTTPAEAEPVSIAQVKAHLGESGMSDEVAGRLAKTQRGYVEKYCGIYLAPQTVTVKCDGFLDLARLPIAPVNAVTTLAYVDLDGADQTIAGSVYELRADGLIARLVLKYNQAWPSIRPGSRLTVTATVGWPKVEDVSTVPDELISAILLRIGQLNALSKFDPLLRRRIIEGVGSREWDTSGTVDAAMTRAVADLLENFRCFPS